MDILIICAQCVRVCIKTSDKLSRAFSYQFALAVLVSETLAADLLTMFTFVYRVATRVNSQPTTRWNWSNCKVLSYFYRVYYLGYLRNQLLYDMEVNEYMFSNM